MSELNLARLAFAPRVLLLMPAPRSAITGWLAGMWRGLVRHAERPGRVVPYY